MNSTFDDLLSLSKINCDISTIIEQTPDYIKDSDVWDLLNTEWLDFVNCNNNVIKSLKKSEHYKLYCEIEFSEYLGRVKQCLEDLENKAFNDIMNENNVCINNENKKNILPPRYKHIIYDKEKEKKIKNEINKFNDKMKTIKSMKKKRKQLIKNYKQAVLFYAEHLENSKTMEEANDLPKPKMLNDSELFNEEEMYEMKCNYVKFNKLCASIRQAKLFEWEKNSNNNNNNIINNINNQESDNNIINNINNQENDIDIENNINNQENDNDIDINIENNINNQESENNLNNQEKDIDIDIENDINNKESENNLNNNTYTYNNIVNNNIPMIDVTNLQSDSQFSIPITIPIINVTNINNQNNFIK